MRSYRLRIAIPLLLLTFNLISVAYISIHRIETYRAMVLKHEREVLESIMIPLQNNLSGRMIENNISMARESFSFAMLATFIDTLFLSDEDNKIIMADDAVLTGSPAESFSGFDPNIARETARIQGSRIIIGEDEKLIYGYFSVILEPEPGELRSRNTGILFVAYNISELIEKSRREAIEDAALMSVFLFIATVFLGLAIDSLVTRRLAALSKAMDLAAEGDLSSRSDVGGSDEIAALSNKFNHMSEKLADSLEMLKHSEGKFRAIAEQMADAILMFDDNGIITYISPAARKIFGCDESELTGRRFFDLLCDDDAPGQLATLSSAMSGSKDIWTLELRFKRSDNTTFYGEASGSRFEHEGSTGTLGLIRDISEKKRAEEKQKQYEAQLMQAQKMELVGQMAGGVAHDFNNLLGIILGNAQIAEIETESNPEACEAVQSIINASMRAKALTSKMLAFSRKDKPDFAPRSAGSIVNSVIDMLSRSISKQITIKTSVKMDGIMLCDANQMHQALLNICSNAADAMPNGGTISIETDKVYFKDHPCAVCGSAMNGEFVSIAISDTGCGMPEETASRMLEPFFTTKDVGKGTGLGMFVTHGIIMDHNGHLHIRSKPGEGTAITIYIPTTANEEGSESSKAGKNHNAEGTETIMVVDDELDILNVVGKQLKKAGYKVELEQDGRQSIKTFREMAGSISLAVLDVMMPGMDGVAVFNELRKINPDIKVLFATGYSAVTNIAYLEDSITRVINKPFEMASLLEAVRNLLDRPVEAK